VEEGAANKRIPEKLSGIQYLLGRFEKITWRRFYLFRFWTAPLFEGIWPVLPG
jgi:hypothetical protein